MSMSAKSAAGAFLQQSFPYCDVAFLGGSAAQQALNEHSDLDIVIINSKQSTSFRECFMAFEWNIEVFVYNPWSLSLAFDTSRLEGIPSILRMCAEGIILKDDGSAADIQNAAREWIQSGPAPWTDEKHQSMRFMITDLLNDLNDSTSDQEKIFVAYKLFALVSEFVLRANGYWMGEGKWMYRSLLHFDKDFCDRYVDAFHFFMKTGRYQPFYTLIDQVLKKHGGQLLGGYKELL